MACSVRGTASVITPALKGAQTLVWRMLVITLNLGAIIAWGSLPASPALAADATGTQKQASKAVEKALETGAPLPSLAEILAAHEEMEALEREVRKRFGDGTRLKQATAVIDAVEKSLKEAATAVDKEAPARVQILALVDLSTEIRSQADKLQAIVDQLGPRVRGYDADLDRLKGLDSEWLLRIDATRQRKAPADLQGRVERMPSRLADLAREVTRRRDANFAVLDRATRILGRLKIAIADAAERRGELMAVLGAVQAEPIWRAPIVPGARDEAMLWAATEFKQLRTYVERNAPTLFAIAGSVFALGYVLVVVARRRLDRDPVRDRESDLARMLLQWPLLWAVVFTLIALTWYSPDAPVVYIGAMLTLIVLVAVILMLTVGAHRAKLSLYTLAVALVVNWFQVGLDSLPMSGRIVLAVQCASVAAALWHDLRRGRISGDVILLPGWAMRGILLISILVLLAAVLADVFGYLGLARQMRDGILRMLGLGLALNLVSQMIFALILVALRTETARCSRIVQYRSVLMIASARSLLRWAGVVAWVVGTLVVFRSVDVVGGLGRLLAEAQIQVGTVTLSLNAVLLCIAIGFVTVYVVRVAKILLEVELLPRLSLTSATAFVISAATRYVLTVAGLILAMAALGLDFSKVTLLVSAIGVGIGFGLQNVVNNFVSGLLLLGERVINVGDTVQVGSLTGVVQRIGVRSSSVKTFQGAEVILPNSDLTSKEVVNFTLSDRNRRLEIVVGVAYGSDPTTVLRLLTEAAVKHSEVLAIPAPLAVFIGFGESSLDFRLQCWIGNYDQGLRVETELRTAILARLNDERIEIPFPQRDIHVRSTPASPISPAPV